MIQIVGQRFETFKKKEANNKYSCTLKHVSILQHVSIEAEPGNATPVIQTSVIDGGETYQDRTKT
jgi:hypothetical protein